MLKNEPDIDIKRRTLIGDTADSLAIRGFSCNRIVLNIDGRPVNASGVVGGCYIDWGTIPLDNIEKIEIIRVRAGRTPCFPKFFEASWEWKGTVEDALEEMAGFIEMHGCRPRHRDIEEVLSRCQRDGRVWHTTEVEEGLMVWPVQQVRILG